jgi:lysophospholipase L1-like esterase
MRRKFIFGVLVLVALALGACATPGSVGGSGGGTAAVASCPTSAPRWAVGDSITAGFYGVAGWPDQPPTAGQFVNLGQPGHYAKDLVPTTLARLASCQPDQLPAQIVFAAGINDIHTTGNAATVEAAVTQLIDNSPVPLRILTIQPMPSFSNWKYSEPQRLLYNKWLLSTHPDIAVDCSTPLSDANGDLLPQYAQDTYAHLTPAGETALSQCVANAEGW